MALHKNRRIRSENKMDQPPSGSNALRHAKREAGRADRNINKALALEALDQLDMSHDAFQAGQRTPFEAYKQSKQVHDLLNAEPEICGKPIKMLNRPCLFPKNHEGDCGSHYEE